MSFKTVQKIPDKYPESKVCKSELCEFAGKLQPRENFAVNCTYADNRSPLCKPCINRRQKIKKDRYRANKQRTK